MTFRHCLPIGPLNLPLSNPLLNRRVNYWKASTLITIKMLGWNMNVANGANLHELILYATPTGDLLSWCNDYFDIAAQHGGTEAQNYPPHCSMTGFFHRSASRSNEAIDALSNIGAKPTDIPIDSLNLSIDKPDWLGIEIQSEMLKTITSLFSSNYKHLSDEDPLRVKEWLHLSLAYGVKDINPFKKALNNICDLPSESSWEVALWQRRRQNIWKRLNFESDRKHEDC